MDAFTDNNEEVLSEDERNALPLVAKLLLLVVEKVAEVDVEQLESDGGGRGGGDREVSAGEDGDGGGVTEVLTCPFSFTMMLELCRSPIPRMKVATQ